MIETVTIDLRHVARGLHIPLRQVQAAVELLDDGNTISFITRYRKDQTGGLDEEQIRNVKNRLSKLRLLSERKQTILRSIEAQGKLTEQLAQRIQAAGTTKRLEDLYLPYKPRKQTLATSARAKGLEELAGEIFEASPACADLDARAAEFISIDRQVATAADALLGAGHILAEQFSERADVRQRLREIVQRTGRFVSARVAPDRKSQPENKESNRKAVVAETADTAPPAEDTGSASAAEKNETKENNDKPDKSNKPDKQETTGQPQLSKKELRKKRLEEHRIKAFQDYFDYREEIKKIPPHRILAINRGERAKVLRVKIEADLAAMHGVLDELLVPAEHPHADYLRGCARDALARLILPGLEREIRRELTDRAEVHAVEVFAHNLRNLLLQPPVHGHRVLAVDPGFKNGCKLAALDQFGNMLEKGVIYLVGKAQRREDARQRLVDLINRYQLSVVAIGNGTACRQTEEFVAGLIEGELKDRGVSYVIVNEAGASVYSTSRIGREELPQYGASLRGAISIGRRLQDPLSELVKIDPANIGVGLYQHDIKAKHLRASLDEVVESNVNYVGVDLNMASPALLRYVSGLNQLTARRVYEHRIAHGPFRNRGQLREVVGFGEATFVQAAGFLKIAAGDNPLDATWIHPESYPAATRVLESLGCTVADLADKQKAAALAERVGQVDTEATAKELGVGVLLLKDILAQLARPGRDPREDLPGVVFKRGIIKLEDLAAGMELTGTVLNVVDFGCFVDIGMHDSGLVHVSQLADKYIRDPHEMVAVGDIVKVWVLEVDKQRRRVSLTMIEPGTQRPHGRRRRDDKDDKDDKPAGEESSRQGGGRSRGRRPAGAQRARGAKTKGPPRRKGPPKPKHYRPKSRPKPFVPISDEMKAGKEPMRTFGDLAQFYDQQEDSDGGEKPDEKMSDDAQQQQDRPQADSDEGTEQQE